MAAVGNWLLPESADRSAHSKRRVVPQARHKMGAPGWETTSRNVVPREKEQREARRFSFSSRRFGGRGQSEVAWKSTHVDPIDLAAFWAIQPGSK